MALQVSGGLSAETGASGTAAPYFPPRVVFLAALEESVAVYTSVLLSLSVLMWVLVVGKSTMLGLTTLLLSVATSILLSTLLLSYCSVLLFRAWPSPPESALPCQVLLSPVPPCPALQTTSCHLQHLLRVRCCLQEAACSKSGTSPRALRRGMGEPGI